ncbi:putative pectinesterase/pectinesterase inhibitor 22 [Benincasa hispida]|uniref:putative pectinesterase/pectinesterase inhibitor 22 n=1 Tax=Benincasa hispida TaxID=102211 RepID=UPI0018FFB4BE|nr:putative pectinesterase/pectinesterase inhibitor 22 [Benincasa hispida]
MNFVDSFTFNTVVSLDGTGNFRSINAAIAAAPSNRKSRFYIHVKPGIYKEHVEIEKKKTFIALIGDNAANTIIVDSRSHATGFNTFQSATFVVKGDNFMAQSITFENSAGPENGQAVALLNNRANHTVYYKCVFLGYQDTLYVNGDNVFFKDSEIYGTVDFIFGYGQAVYQDYFREDLKSDVRGLFTISINHSIATSVDNYLYLLDQLKTSDLDNKTRSVFNDCVEQYEFAIALLKSSLEELLKNHDRDKVMINNMSDAFGSIDSCEYDFEDFVTEPPAWLARYLTLRPLFGLSIGFASLL